MDKTLSQEWLELKQQIGSLIGKINAKAQTYSDMDKYAEKLRNKIREQERKAVREEYSKELMCELCKYRKAYDPQEQEIQSFIRLYEGLNQTQRKAVKALMRGLKDEMDK